MDEQEIILAQESETEENAVNETTESSGSDTPAESTQQPEESLTQAQKSVLELISRYPGLAPEDIPESVWEDFSQGRGGLAELYTRSENQRLEADNEALRQRISELEQAAENSRRSTNSRRSDGARTGSIIDSVWYAD